MRAPGPESLSLGSLGVARVPCEPNQKQPTMKPTILTLAISILAFATAFSADEPAKKEPDPFDVTALQKRMDEVGVPTPTTVQQLEAKATALAKDSKWQEAADAYSALAKNANWLANLIHAGIEPFYNASYDDRKSYSIKDSDLKLEKQSNEYKNMRNQATVAQAECYIRLNDIKRAMPILVRSLELINVKDAELWARARKDLYSIIQVTE